MKIKKYNPSSEFNFSVSLWCVCVRTCVIMQQKHQHQHIPPRPSSSVEPNTSGNNNASKGPFLFHPIVPTTPIGAPYHQTINIAERTMKHDIPPVEHGSTKGKVRKVRKFNTFMSRLGGGGGSDNSQCRTMSFLVVFMLIVGAVVVGISLYFERQSFMAAHIIEGPQGPMGVCNISHANQTFLIAGNTTIGENLIVTKTLTVGGTTNNDAMHIYKNGTCMVFNSTLPMCIVGGIKTNSISPLSPNSNLTLYGPTLVDGPTRFYGNTSMDTLHIGGATFKWNGTRLIISGPTNLGTTVPIPMSIGNAGIIDEINSCISFSAPNCMVFGGGGSISFDSPIGSSLVVRGSSSVFNQSIFLNNQNQGISSPTSPAAAAGLLHIFANAGPVNVSSITKITLAAPVVNVMGNLTIMGNVTDTLKLSEKGFSMTCLPGPQIGGLKFETTTTAPPPTNTCGCLTLSSTTGICMNASGAQGIRISSGGNVTLQGATTKLNFVNGAEIGTSVNVRGALNTYGPLTTHGPTTVNGNMVVNGNISFTHLEVTENANFLGPITASHVNNLFVGIQAGGITTNVTISKVNTIFQGLGATFQSGTTLQILSNLFISTNAGQLKCTSPIFAPNTATTPNAFPCVPTCTDMRTCSHKMKNLEILGEFILGADPEILADPSLVIPNNVRFGWVNGRPIESIRAHAIDIVLQSDNCIQLRACVTIESTLTIWGGLHILGGIFFGGDAPISSTSTDNTFNTLRLTNKLTTDSGASVTLGGAVNISGPILQEGNPHPCCNRIDTTGSIPTSRDTKSLLLIVGISSVTTTLATSGTSRIPFNIISTSTSKLSTSYSITNYLYTAPTNGMHAITVYLSLPTTQSSLGDHRGVIIHRTFGGSGIYSALTICTQKYPPPTAATHVMVTCNYNGYFDENDSFWVAATWDHASGGLILSRAGSSGSLPGSRVEIYMYA